MSADPIPLLDLCAKATPGPWETSDNAGCRTIGNTSRAEEGEDAVCTTAGLWNDDKDKANAQLIARCSPETMRAVYKALAFYADDRNYHPTGWQGDPDPAPVDHDDGKRARLALCLLDGRGERTIT